jgi:plastocyanin
MRGKYLVLTALLAVAAIALAGCGGGGGSESSSTTTTETTGTETTTTTTSTSATKLIGTVGEEGNPDAFTITLTTEDGSDVTTLTPGSYTIEVNDLSSIHDFHLSGPGVDKSTDVSGKGTETWTVTLQDGTYNFVCDPHASSMNGSFTVSG